MAKRPRDPNQLAKMIVDIATGQIEDSVSEQKRNLEIPRGRIGGLKGGKARAEKLTPNQRAEIAKKAAGVRWRVKA